METDDVEFASCLDLVQEYLDLRKILDELMRDGFLSLAKARCDGSGSSFPAVPRRTTATRKIVVLDYKPEILSGQRVDEPRVGEPSDEIKDFIHGLALKYDCEIDDRNVLRETNIHEELPLSGLWNECKGSFTRILHAIEDMVQVVYKLNVCMERQKLGHLGPKTSGN